MSQDVLPDSRLKSNPTFGSKMVDWPMPDGTTVRVEAVIAYCISCGKPLTEVPHDNTIDCVFLCRKCFEKWGGVAGMMVFSSDQFFQMVAEEIQAKFGRPLTIQEIAAKAENGELGKYLDLLARESPVKLPSHE